MTIDPGAARLRWVIWGLPTFLFLIAFFHRAVPGVLARDLMRDFGVTSTTVGLLSAIYFYAYAGLMIPAGVLVDTFDVRKVVATGGVVMGVGTLAMAVAPTPAWLFSGRLLVGSGAVVMFVGALKVAADWFPPSYFGTLSAITAAIGTLGGLIGTAPFAWLVSLTGWRRALGVVAFVTLAASGLGAVMVTGRPPTQDPSRAPGAAFGSVVAGLRQVLGNRHTWPPFLAFFFLVAAGHNLLLWVVSYLRDVYGLSLTDAALYATATSAAVLVAGPLTGFVSDRVLERRKLPYTVLTGAQFACWVVFLLTLGQLPLGALYALFFGMGVVGGAFVLTWPLGRELNPPHLAGVAVAAVNFGGLLGVALTQGPLGALLDANWTGGVVAGARVYPVEAYRVAFSACAGLVFVSTLLTLLLRETGARNIYHTLKAGTRNGMMDSP